MASTIQIKRGTGSAVPSDLEDGELAINLDNGQLYFGSGSNTISSFRFENLTAENYIISSSVTNIITQTLSGSTAFGDSSDDTHQFTGALTASGNISASGNILGGGITINGNSIFNGSTITLGDAGGDRINANASFATRIKALSHITASGNISSSGTITAASLDAAAVSDTLAAAIVAEIDNDEIPIAKLAEDAVTVTAGTGLTGGGSITLGGSATVNVIGGDGITANANDIAINAAQTTITSILASNVKIGEDDETKIDFETADEIHFYANNAQEMVIQANVVAPGADDGTALGDADQRWSDLFLAEGGVINFDNGDVTITQTSNKLAIEGTDSTSFVGNVTASGNISSSGTIIAATLDATAVSDTLAAAIVAEIDNDEIPIAKLAEDAVTVTAGTGLTGGGSITLGGSATVNVIGGTGVTANANDIAIGQDVATTANVQFANISSSANISASANVYAADYFDNGANINTIYSPIAGSTDIVTVGTIGTGVWEGTLVDVEHGGTGLATVGTNEILTGNGTGALTSETNLTFSGNRLIIGADAAVAPHIRFLNDENTVNIGVSATADGLMAGSADGDFVINCTGDHNLLIGQNDATALTIDTNGDSNFNRRFTVTGATDGTYEGDVVYFGGTTSMTVGTIYHYKSDGTWEVANANGVATSDGLLGVALGAASDTNGMLLRGMVTLDHDPGAVGDVLYLSNTNGDASATAPSDSNDVVRVIGYCLHASAGNIWFNPDSTFVEIA